MKIHNTVLTLLLIALLPGVASASTVVTDVNLKGELTDKYVGESGTLYVCMHTNDGLQYNALPVNEILYNDAIVGSDYRYSLKVFDNGLRSILLEPTIQYPAFSFLY